MSEKIIKYLLAYALMFISVLLFFSSLGYYLFLFDWHGTRVTVWMNAGFLVVIVAASIAIYAVAEKIKSQI
ncbi:hypothetical protein [Kosakonia oryziphila]|uniref:Uncharacterized protein n=1 Tax=Kosakonia oryziphila TaxID=1005667 RepID=A0A1C4AXN3_9ENTR|nr:hypothetical protein [Kosakonia oryziphila]SCB99339.1 hypothetical protein GA0061070_100621 [Kosakonia oryziphila]